MKVAWIDAQIGISGDMLLAALVDAGAREVVVQESVRRALGAEVLLSFAHVTRFGMMARRLELTLDTSPPLRHLAQIRQIIGEAALDPKVAEDALRVFELIADAESHVHGIHKDDVYFHEVGAWDSMADVIGTCAAWHDLGIETGTTSVISVGSGISLGQHGAMPVPVPCVTELLARAQARATAGPLNFEACTPTGAALACTLAGRWGKLPDIRLSSIGVGAGLRDPEGVANVTRVILGETHSDLHDEIIPSRVFEGAEVERLTELSTNIDDMEPRLWPEVLKELLAAGALDVWLTPILMKKGRPAQELKVLCEDSTAEDLMTALFAQTTTLGVRLREIDRVALVRAVDTVELDGSHIRMKVGFLGRHCVTAQPEWEDVVLAAEDLGLSCREIIAESLRKWRSEHSWVAGV